MNHLRHRGLESSTCHDHFLPVDESGYTQEDGTGQVYYMAQFSQAENKKPEQATLSETVV